MAKRLADMTEPEIAHYLNLLATATEAIMPEAENARGRNIFAVLIFDEPGIMRMVTNGQRADVWKAIRDAMESPEV